MKVRISVHMPERKLVAGATVELEAADAEKLIETGYATPVTESTEPAGGAHVPTEEEKAAATAPAPAAQ